MDESGQKSPEGNNSANYSFVMGRALLSAGFFGVLGGWLGGWLGKRGNAPVNGMAYSIMKWGMGIISAILAAYSSLKASEYSNQQKADTTPSGTDRKDETADKTVTPDSKKIPLSSVQIAGAEQQKLLETQGLQRN